MGLKSIFTHLRKRLHGRAKNTYVDIYLKSGSVISVDTTSFKFENTGSEITRLTWSTEGEHHLHFVGISQIEAIVSRPYD